MTKKDYDKVANVINYVLKRCTPEEFPDVADVSNSLIDLFIEDDNFDAMKFLQDVWRDTPWAYR